MNEEIPEKELFCYVDETGTPEFQSTDDFGLGALLTTRPICPSLIQGALDGLSNYSGKNRKKDQKTIDRGFFHASQDSKNGHSLLCTEIANFSGSAEFYFELIRKNQLDEKDTEYLKDPKKMHENVLAAISVPLLKYSTKKINLFVAKRLGSFTSHQSSSWEQWFFNLLLNSAIRTPQLPLKIPEFEVSVTDGSNPGVQFCDFILWATTRKQSNNSDPWLERSNFKFTDSYKLQSGHLEGHRYVKSKINYSTNTADKLPTVKDVEERLRDLKQLADGLVAIELSIMQLQRLNYIPTNKFLRQYFIDSKRLLSDLNLNNDELHHIAKTYLLLCDEAPLYKLGSKDEIQEAYFRKTICSRILNKTLINWKTMTKYWRDVREINIQVLENYSKNGRFS